MYKRLTDANFALDSDVMAAALLGYRQLKVAAGLDTLQREVATRFAKKSRIKTKPPADPSPTAP